MSYSHGTSLRKGGTAALPVMPACVVIWAARQFWGIEIPAEVGAALVGLLPAAVVYLRNLIKHRGRGR